MCIQKRPLPQQKYSMYVVMKDLGNGVYRSLYGDDRYTLHSDHIAKYLENGQRAMVDDTYIGFHGFAFFTDAEEERKMHGIYGQQYVIIRALFTEVIEAGFNQYDHLCIRARRRTLVEVMGRSKE